MELLKAFGDLKAFNLIKDSTTGISKGFGFCEYVDPLVSDVACQGLNGMEIGDKKLIVQRASATSLAALEYEKPVEVEVPMLPIDILQSMMANPAPPTRILVLLNMVCEDDLMDDLDFEGIFYFMTKDIYNDMMDETSKYGTVEKILIPRPSPIEDKEDVRYVVPGVGKVIYSVSQV
jgi:splicing factor U2AF subunit